MPDEPRWDYGHVPQRRWEWTVDFDPSLHCPAEKWVVARPIGLVYAGDCHHPNWGGGYGIGSQTYEQFLTEGPLPEQMPDAIAEEIRAHVIAHRRPHSDDHDAP